MLTVRLSAGVSVLADRLSAGVSVSAVRFSAASGVSVSTGRFSTGLSEILVLVGRLFVTGLSACVKILSVGLLLPFLEDASFGTT